MNLQPKVRGRNAPSLALGQFSAVLEKVEGGCLACLFLLAPLCMGGRGPLGRTIALTLIGIAVCSWMVRQCFKERPSFQPTNVEGLLLAGVALIAFQLVSLPTSALHKLSPSIRELLPMWSGTGGEQLGTWSTLSLTPEATRSGLAVYICYAFLFVLLVQRLKTWNDIHWLLRMLALASVLMAVIGLAQLFTNSSKFLWVYEHPARSACSVAHGTFQNENHFAHFLALGFGPLMWCIRQSGSQNQHLSRGRKKPPSLRESVSIPAENLAISSAHGISPQLVQSFFFASLVTVVLAVLLTYSRGGLLAMAVALVTCVVTLSWKRLVSTRMTWILGSVAAVIVAAMGIVGTDSLYLQLASVTEAKSVRELFYSRLDLWRAMANGIAQFWLTGTGIGSHAEVYPVFMEEFYDVEFSHGESGYLPLLLEAGVVGLGLMLSGIAVVAYWCAVTIRCDNRPNDRATERLLADVSCAVIPGLMASVVHSIFDFVWYIPACMVMTIALAAVACRLFQLSRDKVEPSRERPEVKTKGIVTQSSRVRWQWSAASLVAILFVVLLLQSQSGTALAALDWDAYLKCSLIHNRGQLKTATDERQRLTNMQEHLVRVLRHEPKHARAHLRLAGVYLSQFELIQQDSENKMDLAQIRDAALASQFATAKEQNEWLGLAFGESRQLLDKALYHNRMAVRLSPLQGVGYAKLAELSFLISPRDSLKQELIAQAIIARPHEGLILFLRGKEAVLAGDIDMGLAYWKTAFHREPELRQLIVTVLSDALPPQQILSRFEPDTNGLGYFFDRYRAQGRTEDAKLMGRRYAESAVRNAEKESGQQAASSWQSAQEAFAWLGDLPRALVAQQHLVRTLPTVGAHRRKLAQLLMQQQKFVEAIEQLEWCLSRTQDDESLAQELAEARSMQTSAGETHTAANESRPGNS